jgi:hypothetical protein
VGDLQECDDEHRHFGDEVRHDAERNPDRAGDRRYGSLLACHRHKAR